MLRLKKVSKVILMVMILCISSLTLIGCGKVDSTVELNSDGSGVYSLGLSVNSNLLKRLNSENIVLDNLDLSNKRLSNKSYGGYVNVEFDDVDELNRALKDKSFNFLPDVKMFDFIEFENNSDTSYVLWLNIDNIVDVFSNKNNFKSMCEELGLSEEDTELLYDNKSDLSVNLEVKLDKNIEVLGDITDSIEVSGKILNIDFMRICKTMKKNETLAILIDMSKDNIVIEQYLDEETKLVNEPIIFEDVRPKAWYYKGVKEVAELGIIAGSNGKFNPNSPLSYAQFCQIILNHGLLNSETKQEDLDTMMKDMGKHNGYWAYSAVDFGLESNLIPYIGDIIPENYDKPIPREVAISSFYQIYLKKTLEGKTPPNVNPIIPDYDSISDIYKENIKAMYQWGVIKGYDDGSFNPSGTLSRGEMCQIFGNVLDK